MNIKEKIRNLKKNISAIFIAIKHKETPWYAKIVAGITIGYALSPIDLIPDFIPVLGYLDDIIILPLLILLSVKLIPKEIMEQSRNEAENLWNDSKSVKWFYAIPVVAIWIVIIISLIKNFIMK